MKEIVYNLIKTEDRPVFILENGTVVLLDTGARIPVWTSGIDTLKKAYSTAKIVKRDVEFGTLQTKAKGDLYTMDFEMKELIYPQMPIVVCESDVTYGMIVSSTMFNGLKVTIDLEDHVLRIGIKNDMTRRLRVSDGKGDFIILEIG